MGDWDAIVFSEVLSYLAVHEAIAEVSRYSKALLLEGKVAISMLNDGKSQRSGARCAKSFVDRRHLWPQKEPWPSYRISVSRGHS